MADNTVDIKGIMSLLPHRYPFLLLDRITGLEPGKSAAGYKNVTINDPFFQGHFPGEPVMPGVLIIEALAQTGAVAVLSMDEYRGKIALFAGIDKLRFKRVVRPGDRLDLSVRLIAMRRGIGKGEAEARVDGEVAVSGQLMFAVMDKDNQ